MRHPGMVLDLAFSSFPPDDVCGRGCRCHSSTDASATSTQLELLAFCELLHGARSPLHPDHAPEAIQCFMKELHDDRVAQGQSFPIEPRLFDETVRELLFKLI